MKKLVTVCALLAIVIVLGVVEMQVAGTYFDGLENSLGEISNELKLTEENSVNGNEIAKLEKLIEEWHMRSDVLYLIYDNVVLNSVSENISTGIVYAQGGQNIDACASIAIARYKLQSLVRDSTPKPLNFL